MFPVVPLTGIDPFHSVLKMRVPLHRGVQARGADPVPAAFLQHAQGFCKETDLLLLADMLDKIFVEQVIDAVCRDWPRHVGVREEEYVNAGKAVVAFLQQRMDVDIDKARRRCPAEPDLDLNRLAGLDQAEYSA